MSPPSFAGFERHGPYKIGTVARLIGVSPAVLRSWERRYHLLEPRRAEGRHRLYSDDDLDVLLRIRELLDQGRSIGEIARTGRAKLLAAGAAARGGDMPPASTISRLTAAAGVRPAEGAGNGRSADRVLSWRHRLVGAAVALDQHGLVHALDEAFATIPAERVIHEVIVPTAHEIGRLWTDGRCSVASEHLASDAFRLRVRLLLDAVQPPPNGAPRIIAACLPDEQHELAPLIAAYHLAIRRMRVDFLGASLPIDDLASACRIASTDAVVLSVTLAEHRRRHLGALVDRLGSDLCPCVYVGGQGVGEVDGAFQSTDAALYTVAGQIPEAIEMIVSSALASRRGR